VNGEHAIGIISDTHGLVRPEAVAALRGVELIVHAGDVGAPKVLERLSEIAPVRAVRGNVDRGAWAASLPATDVVEVAARSIYVLHNLADLDLDPEAARLDIVVSGHSHQPTITRRGSVTYVNPGSAGPRRFRLPIALARLAIGPEAIRGEIIRLSGRVGGG
jgi:hypothetical protein